MKHAKKLLSLLLVLLMVIGFAVPAAAADATAKITIDDGGINGAEYGAYQLLEATNAPNDTGTGGSDKFAYTVNGKYRAALMSALNLSDTEAHIVTDAEIIDAIENLRKTDGAVQSFANAVYAQIKTMKVDASTADKVFQPLHQGYYLIVETKIGEAQPTDTFSLVMLDTAGLDAITVKTKEQTPTVTKQVQEVNDTTGATNWDDSADHDIGDTVNFKIVGTVSDKYAYYNEYGYKFEDTMGQGLTLKPETVKISIDGTDITNQFKLVTSTNGFVAYTNLKDLTGVTVAADTEILVEYQATLNSNAALGAEGNRNTVILHYENNPYAEDYVTPSNPDEPDVPPKDPDDPPTDPDNPPELPGKTPPAVTIIFTFEGSVNKVDKDGKALKGAGFTLYKNYYVSDTTSRWEAVGSEIKLTDSNVFSWKGLDAGKYKLVETSVPDGYNKAADLIFIVEATYTDSDPDALASLVIKDENKAVISSGTEPVFTISSEYVFSTNIVNLAGAELPETGGMGTTLIYVVGGILFTAALVLLITKKRMASEK